MQEHQQRHKEEQPASDAHRIGDRHVLAEATPDQPNPDPAHHDGDHKRTPAKHLVDKAQPDAHQRAGFFREEAEQRKQRDDDQRPAKEV